VKHLMHPSTAVRPGPVLSGLREVARTERLGRVLRWLEGNQQALAEAWSWSIQPSVLVGPVVRFDVKARSRSAFVELEIVGRAREFWIAEDSELAAVNDLYPLLVAGWDRILGVLMFPADPQLLEGLEEVIGAGLAALEEDLEQDRAHRDQEMKKLNGQLLRAGRAILIDVRRAL